MELLCYWVLIAWMVLVRSKCASAYSLEYIDWSKPLDLEQSTTWGRWSIQVRPIGCHWSFLTECSCCYCRPFPVGKLDWPVIGSVGLFSRNSRPCSNSSNSVSYLLILSIQPPACLSWTSGFLLWWTRSRSWSLEWVVFFAFAFSDLQVESPGETVLRGPHSYRIFVWIHTFLSLFDILWCVDSNSVEVWLEYSDCNSLASWAWKWGFHSDFDHTPSLPLTAATGWLQITWRCLCQLVSRDYLNKDRAPTAAIVFLVDTGFIAVVPVAAHASLNEWVSQSTCLLLSIFNTIFSILFGNQDRNEKGEFLLSLLRLVLDPVGYDQYSTRSTCLSGLRSLLLSAPHLEGFIPSPARLQSSAGWSIGLFVMSQKVIYASLGPFRSLRVDRFFDRSIHPVTTTVVNYSLG